MQIKRIPTVILFSPFLLVYILYVYYFHTDQMIGDESRYYQFAENLLNGFYSPAFPSINLFNGPGYPIILIPFVALKMPLITITLFNALLQYLSVLLVYKSIQLITGSFKISFLVAICWGSYFLAYQEMSCILTECFTSFLISLFCYQTIELIQLKQLKFSKLLFSGFVLGMLALTKVIFAYVILSMLCIYTALYLFKKTHIIYKRFATISMIAFFTLSPYIIYTYQLTGKVFYLSNASGEVLYWMTSLSDEEYGDWNNHNFDGNCHNKSFCNASFIAKNHQEDYNKINQTKSSIEADSLFKAMAIANFKTNPLKYAKNWFSNIGRLLFGFPASYYFQSPVTLVRIYVNSIVLLAMVYSLILFVLNWKSMPKEIMLLVIFSLLYLGLSSLVSAYPRQFNVMVPALLIWTTYIIRKSVKINLKIDFND